MMASNLRPGADTALCAASAAMLLLLFWAPPPLLAQPAQKCAVCTGSGVLECPPCAGTGLQEKLCNRCNGNGRHACRTCGKWNQSRRFGTQKVRKGYIPCPNGHCRNGKLMVDSSRTVKCKVCSGRATLDCKVCASGLVRCMCKKKPVFVVCRDCAGSGRLLCPGCQLQPSADTCLLCGGKEKRRCKRCMTASGKARCAACSGRGTTACATCRGLNRRTCSTCSGAGKTFGYDFNKGRPLTASCSSCRSKGWGPCWKCKRGLTDCTACERGTTKRVCGHCASGKVVCGGCVGGLEVGLLTLAHVLVDTEHYAEATRWYKAARQVAEMDLEKFQKKLKLLETRKDKIKGIKKAVGRLSESKAIKALERTLKRTIARKKFFIRSLEDDAAEVASWVADSSK